MDKCRWWQFHDWIYTGEKRVIQPKRGPYDPRSEQGRSQQRWTYVCARCGETMDTAMEWPDL